MFICCRPNILALALGSGEVCIVRIPDPASLAGPLVDIEPLTAIRVPGSPASVLEWLPTEPYDRLLVSAPFTLSVKTLPYHWLHSYK